MSTFTAELGTPDSSPGLALSLLRNRHKAVEFRGTPARQVGFAFDFRLEELVVVPAATPDSAFPPEQPSSSSALTTRTALVCRVSLDEAAHDEIKHLLTDGKDHLYVENLPLIGAVAP